MNNNEQKKRIIRARLTRMPIFLGIVFLFAWMFRWELGTTAVTEGSFLTAYTKLDRWTGATYGCVFRASTIPTRDQLDRGVVCEQEQP